MTTLERPQQQIQTAPTPTPAHRSSRQGIIMALVAVLALVVGGVIGYVMRGGDDATPEFLLAGEGELTARQEQMVEFANDAYEVWSNGNGEASAALFVENGNFRGLGIDHPVADGSLARYAEGSAWQSIELLHPVLINGNELIGFQRWEGSVYRTNMTFTSSGELLIVSMRVTS